MAHPSNPSSAATIDLSERGAERNGAPQRIDRRLFFQFVAVQCPQRPGPKAVAEQLQQLLTGQGLAAVIYADIHHPMGLGVVACSEDPDRLALEFRDVFTSPSLTEGVQIREHYSMLGRSYSTGFESDLEFWLLQRPRRTLLDPTSQYAIWYPLRRKGPFERLDPREKGTIMQEHGGIGRAYGDQGLAHDIRLACHGLDPNDNDFIVGLVGKDLHPLSHVVQAMRKTVQTAEYMEKMGPFFVGRVLFRIEA